MGNRLFCNRGKSMRVTDCRALLIWLWVAAGTVAIVPRAAASGDAPQWMHALVGAPLSAYDEKTNAVLLYSERHGSVAGQD